jgi:hypothetical protein
MLRVTVVSLKRDAVTLALEGRFVGDWARMVEALSREHGAARRTVTLDLRLVSLVDREGIQTLRRLAEIQTNLTNCSGLIADLVAGDPPPPAH